MKDMELLITIVMLLASAAAALAVFHAEERAFVQREFDREWHEQEVLYTSR